jgi:hypothetical protein
MRVSTKSLPICDRTGKVNEIRFTLLETSKVCWTDVRKGKESEASWMFDEITKAPGT